MSFSLQTPAKINWTLSIIGKRDDGYHDIISPTQCVSLFDSLTFEEAGEVEMISDLDIPVDQNLVYRAAVLLKKYSSVRRGARILLKKDIPVGAGLGGGSSDAACTLKGLNRLWGLDLPQEELMSLGSQIGSDVPFFIGGPFSLVEGRGEKVTTLKAVSAVDILIVKPDISISTSWAYSSYVVELTKKGIDIKLFCQILDRRDFVSLRDIVLNDLKHVVAVRYPVIAEIEKMLIKKGAVISLMSGSGSAVFGVFESADKAIRASADMGKYWYRVVKTLV
jgi:4-diphosphocytidyl-2-C-methyl-D-erythritol kinase